ncbi:response regulator transcription factor [Virgibacillus sp. NKC19-3]|uniref:response regulator transcription factor n=1 Tax=Virgibacillus saliphilus TaxID=2831674 RepID=UPI001C9B25E3|nr:response regulator transcription factor [Virgibacillus sp. NKC19-3]MBY7141981.1 response regulator transcription factor [Virgibacillus sp. NKC19-3]
MKLFIVEDDTIIAQKIKQHMKKWGYEGAIVQDFQNVLSEAIAFDPQLILMDISLPFFNGYYWCGEIRKVSKTPIIFISSATDNMNIVRAIEMGADDYITKPFDFEVLVAKIHAILRRTYDFNAASNVIEHRGLIFNINNFTISFKDQTEELTKNEAKIFQTLMENKGKIIKRDKLMMTLWESDSFVDDSALYTNINRLRKKLDHMGLEHFITTKKGEGYMIEGSI